MAAPGEREGGRARVARTPRSGGAPVAPARRCAYAVVRRVFEQRAYADQALQSEARELDARDRALAMRLAYGAVQRRLTLDHLIEQLAGRPPEQLDPPLLAALRLGLYELLYLSGAPDRAVVADCVELSKSGGGGGHGLVNAVLRRAAREGACALLGGLSEDTPEHAAIAHSHPEWIARLWWQELGAPDALALMAADNEPGELSLRVNTLRADPGAVASEIAVATHTDAELPEALVLEGSFDLHGSSAWDRGALTAQSRAAMLVSRALDPQPGERVLDLCAAPGGKSTHLAALMADQGEVLAVEHNPRRAGELRETARRLHARSVRVEVSDAALSRPEGAVFDRVLVDPPCSGLGTLQARPDLRWRVTPEQVSRLAALQAKILTAGALALRPGGVLVYSTCTLSRFENELQVERFLARSSGFALEDLCNEQQIHTHPWAPKYILTMPHRDHTAGFFIARMRRMG
ncbi:MAG TPA: 16S rRNA (cytosine(967)-C(5))-methyltransferase RsmB [Solirubrobacteraceae bacterium]|jgi:16S rRNA (cytosine967-C5)-methyltransferase|nr:16S rRNA (cytosine(967)-C(5))-methyltransferase RsmB [Solirubrobacteraceae bacterium]